jgi:hypothetical protein
MNAIQPAAHVRAVTGIQGSKAGTGSIAHCAWNRSLLWLLVRFLPVVILICLSITPVHADGVNGTITNGKTVNGTLSGKGVDIYTFKVPVGGGTFVVSLAESGPHNDTFIPTITLTAPDGDIRGRGAPLFTVLKKQNAVEGTWKVTVDQKGRGTVSGNYALTLVQVPGAVPASGGITVGALSPGAISSGSNSRGKIDVWTFNGVAGHTSTLTLNKTGGDGFDPEIAVVSPTGSILGGASCDSCAQDYSITAGGTYTVLAWKGDHHDVTGTYTLSVRNKN